MKNSKLNRIQITSTENPDAIKNYIVSDSTFKYPEISTEHPFIIDGVAIIMCKGGSGKVRINFREFTVEKNTIVSIFPYYIVEFIDQSKNEDFELEFIVFSVDFVTSIDLPRRPNFDISQKILESPCLKVTNEEFSAMLDFHSFIVKQYNRKDHPFRESLARTLLYALFTEIAAIYISKDELNIKLTHNQEIVNRFFLLLVEHHRDHRNVVFYADKMFLTPKYLTTLIKKKTGKNVLAWINESVIVSAKYMLKTTTKTVAEISDELNFPNPSFFGRLFKKVTGLTPVQYRRN